MLQPGQQIENYRIDSILGEGGMGTIYRATDVNLMRPVAVKVMHGNLAADPTFQAELDGFMLIKKQELKKTIHIDNREDISNLFAMTPYAHRTGKNDITRLEQLDELYTATEFGIYIYQKM